MNRAKLFPDVSLASISKPEYRTLRTYSIDPSLALRIDSFDIAHRKLLIPWEQLEPGPKGEYLEVIDWDPAVRGFYLPVDLDDPSVLHKQGLDPSPANPCFHQQMVYATAMATICSFEQAWGRLIQWAPRYLSAKNPHSESFLRRLRLYPHGMRAENAFYDRKTGSVIFGYFRARSARTNAIMPQSIVFSCLSSDIVTHEMTHAILDGIHPKYIEGTNADMLAFHEAFADMIALLQHFTDKDLIFDQITKGRGSLDTENQLSKLASEFGQGTSGYSALRDALGAYDANGNWVRKKPDPSMIQHTEEAHARGALLVTALFDAFLTIYRQRTRDLLRIATNGSGVLPSGDIHPDLVRRLASEAALTAKQFMAILVRAIDYCPPVDLTFGEYLRALITADIDRVGLEGDRLGYRVAIIEAFSAWGIYPAGVNSMSVEALKWQGIEDLVPKGAPRIEAALAKGIRDCVNQLQYALSTYRDREVLLAHAKASTAADQVAATIISGVLGLESNREQAFWKRIKPWNALSADRKKEAEAKLAELTNRELEFYTLKWFRRRIHTGVARVLKQYKTEMAKATILNTLGIDTALPFEVHSARVSQFSAPVFHADSILVYVELIQRTQADGMKFEGGCTLVIDAIQGKIKYAIRKGIASEARKQKQKEFIARSQGLASMYLDTHARPFAIIHSGVDQ